jgi:hypothetical protein
MVENNGSFYNPLQGLRNMTEEENDKFLTLVPKHRKLYCLAVFLPYYGENFAKLISSNMQKRSFVFYDIYVFPNMNIWNNHPVYCTAATLLQLAVQTSRQSKLSEIRFTRHGIPVRSLRSVGSFHLFLPLPRCQQNLQPTVIRNSAFQFNTSKNIRSYIQH